MDAKRATLSPPPIPDNLCELRRIVLEIFHATEPSQYVTAQVKNTLRDCTRHLEAECNKLANLTHLGHRAAEYTRDVLCLRIKFFEALDRRIDELSQLRSNFVESRDAFRAQPTKLLLEGIRESKRCFRAFFHLSLTSRVSPRLIAKGGFYDGMFSKLRPHFDRIERYYYEINVSLRVEEECLRRISSSLRVTPGDKLRWENIRDACGAASTILTPEVGSTCAPVSVSSRLQRVNQAQPPPPQQTVSTSVVRLCHCMKCEPFLKTSFSQSNKAARYIRALAQTVTDARQSLLQSHQDIVGQPKSSLWRLRDVYESSQVECRQKIEEVHGFSEDFLQSFVEVPPLDDFHGYLLPSAVAESSCILQDVHKQVQSTREAFLRRFTTYLLTLKSTPARVRRAVRPPAATRSFLKFRALSPHCRCVDAASVRNSPAACPTPATTRRPASRCVPHDETQTTQGGL